MTPEAFDKMYYTAPPQEVFDQIKEAAIKIWSGYDDTYGYATEKINRIKDIKNIKDNAWYIAAMFDVINQCILLGMLKGKAREMLRDILEENMKQLKEEENGSETI